MAIISEPVGFNPGIETRRVSITQAGLASYLFPGLNVHPHGYRAWHVREWDLRD